MGCHIRVTLRWADGQQGQTNESRGEQGGKPSVDVLGWGAGEHSTETGGGEGGLALR